MIFQKLDFLIENRLAVAPRSASGAATAADTVWVTPDLQNAILALLLPFCIWGLHPHSGKLCTNYALPWKAHSSALISFLRASFFLFPFFFLFLAMSMYYFYVGKWLKISVEKLYDTLSVTISEQEKMGLGWDNKDRLMEQINFNVIINFPPQLICLFAQVHAASLSSMPKPDLWGRLEVFNALLYFPADQVLASFLFPFCSPLLFSSHHLSVHVGTCNYDSCQSSLPLHRWALWRG